MIRKSQFLIAVLLILVIGIGAPFVAGAPSPKKNKKKKNKDYDPLAAQSFMRQGHVFMQQRRYEEALASFREADVASPGNATVYNMMGLCYQSLDQDAQALEHYDKALQLIPGFTDARNNRGTTYLELQQFRMAEVDFIAVLSDSTYPHRWKVFYNLGITYLAQGHIGAAEENFRKAIAAPDPVYEAYLRMAEIAQAQGRLDSALDLLQEARLKHPERYEASLVYGRLLIDVGRASEARPYLEEVINSSPSSALADEARELLGQL